MTRKDGYNGDAYWQVPRFDYVDTSPPLTTSLFDDPEKLDATWRAAVESLRAQQDEPPEVTAAIIAGAEALLNRLNVEHPSDS